MNPICVSCQKIMRCSKNGRILHDEAHGDVGYRHADEYACPKCGHKILMGFGGLIKREQVTDEEMKTVVVLPAR